MKRIIVLLGLIGIIAVILAGVGPVLAREEEHYHVTIDVKPGSIPNPINLKSNGLIPVALFGSSEFDVLDIDISTVGLHPHERMEAAIAPIKYAFNDVNKDGFQDVISHFPTQALAQLLLPDDSALCLHGDNPDVTPHHFCGMDSVVLKFE